MQAMELLQRAVVLLRAELGPRHPRVGDALNSLAGNAMMRVKLAPEAADSTTAEALAVNRAIYIEPHVGTWTAVYARAEFLNRMGSTAEAEPLAREAVDLARAISGRGSADRDDAEVDESSGIDKGFGVGEDARASNVASTGASAEASNTLLWTSNNLLGRILYSQERFAEAVQVQRPTYEHWRRSFGPEYMVTLIAEVVLAESLAGLGRHDEAESMMLHAYVAFESTRGRNDLHTRSAANSLSLFYEARGRMSDASRYRELSEASK